MKSTVPTLLPAALLLVSAPVYCQAPAVVPGVGDLTFSEVMFNPLCVQDNDGEWFEVTNISGKVLDLNGLYFQDGYVPGASGDRYFRVLPTVATLPPMYPGQRFIFARKANPTLNNGLPWVDYEYTAPDGSPVPLDFSQVGHTQMNMGNSAPDGMHISVNNAAFFGGTVIASTSYVPNAAPIFPSDGYSYEAVDLYVPMVALSVTQNSPNMKQPLPTATYGLCMPQEFGTPGGVNSVEATTWKAYVVYNDTLNQNTGILTTDTPVSLSQGYVLARMKNGSPFQSYTLGIADDRGELPLSLVFFAWTGAILLDLNTAAYLFDPNDNAYYFDPNGEAALLLQVPQVPQLLGHDFDLQWLGFDVVSGQLKASHGIEVVVTP